MKRGLASLFAASLGLAASLHAGSAQAQSPADPSAQAAALDSQRDIVLAVDNPLVAVPVRAGSNVLGYASAKPYGAGRQAVSALEALKRRYGLSEMAAWPIKPLGLYCAVLRPPPGVSRDELLAALAADDRVQLAQPLQDFAVYASSPVDGKQTAPAARYNDPYIDLQRGFIATDAADAQTHTQGQGVEVAIVDTGADTTHPDLRGRIRGTHDLVDAQMSPSFDREAHGTEVAGIIAANSNNHLGIAGIAPKAMLSIYKACWYPAQADAGARCNSFTLAKALVAVSDSRARVVNLSLGGPTDPLLRRLLGQLLDQRRIVVAALPPDGRLAGFPTDTPGVIAVRASRSTTAPAGVLDAPGDDILTTQPGGGYDFSSGSSMAAAHVSGVAALLVSLAPELDARSVQALMLKTRKPSEGTLQVNAEAAVEALNSTTGKSVSRTVQP
jgi:subtilisin family serine protease